MVPVVPVRRPRPTKPEGFVAAPEPAGGERPLVVTPLTVPTDDEVRAWLLSRGVSAWGQTFTIIEGKESLGNAVDWVHQQIRSFLEWRASAEA